ncbi:YceI family protein [Roseomonas elaeocarpi]|uniref:YceI family protein n=1 Tax=Roseomonas elaeocarpi TaxID=907779 RepID=A0ABV6JYL4_9PROT
MINRRAFAGLLMLAQTMFLPAMAQDAPPAMNRDPMAIRAGNYVLDPQHGKITWAVTHVGLSLYQGQFTNLSGKLTIDPANLDRTSLQIEIPVDGLRANEPELDQHLRTPDFLDMAKFPTASFTATKVERVGERGGRVRGNLTLHGITKPVTLRVNFNAAGVHPVSKRYTLGFDGHTTIRRSQFGIVTMVPAVGDEVKLDLEGEFQLVE